MKINKREQKFLVPAVSYDWKIEEDFRGNFFWEGDKLCPVRVGTVCDGLIKKGILERVSFGEYPSIIRITTLGRTFKCGNGICHNGHIYNDDDDEMPESYNCVECDALGVVSDNQWGRP